VWLAAQEILDKQLPPPREWAAYDFAKAMGLTQSQATRLYNMLRKRDNLAAQIRWYPGAIEFVHSLLDCGIDVCFVTKPWDGISTWVRDRRHQLKEHFPEQDVEFTSNKHRIAGHFLLDDCVDNLRRNVMRGLLFDQPWNRGPESKGYRRVRGFEHAFKRIVFGEIDEETEVTELGCSALSVTPPVATPAPRVAASR
jgi:5'(3')-deoxyribonucleotidase